jgi:hypothetical protein
MPTPVSAKARLSLKQGFDGAQFTKNSGYVDFAGSFNEGNFDTSSTMMYPSSAFAEPECWPESMGACPLVAIDRLSGIDVGNS